MARDKRDKELDLVEDDDEELEDDEDLEEMYEGEGTSGIAGFIGGLMLGAMLGAGIALLIAPERGDVTRRRLRNRFQDVAEDARDQFDDWRDSAERELRRGRRTVKRKLRGDD